MAHVLLAAGSEAEILNYLDDHSRLCVASVASRIFASHDVTAVFRVAAAGWGFPESVLRSQLRRPASPTPRL